MLGLNVTQKPEGASTTDEYNDTGVDATYQHVQDDGSNTSSPDSNGYLLQLEYVPFGKMDSPYRPWMNIRIGLQYVSYSKFNGGSSNYDGFGRSASDNDTLFAFVWLAL